MDIVDTDQLREQMAQKLGLSTLSQERQYEVIDKVTEALLKTIFLETVEKLSKKERDEMGVLMDNEETTPEQMEEYLRDKIDNYDDFLQEIVDKFLDNVMKESVEK